MARQREGFLNGAPGPDFPGGEGEAHHIGRPTERDLRSVADEAGLQSMGFARLVANDKAASGVRKAVRRANAALGL
jgi:hypothetical protein